MEFRPCIDIHNGKVKQIVGGTLRDDGDLAEENFVSEQDAGFFAKFYQKKKLTGGHIILLNSKDSPYYESTREQAKIALGQYPGGLQVGGGITAENASEFLEYGASHVIVTSYVFSDGVINWERLKKLVQTVGREHLVLDLSCRKKENRYMVVTDRWQKFTGEEVTSGLLARLGEYCDEFLIHAVDVEGKASGIEQGVVELLASAENHPVTYAGGIGSYEDLQLLKSLGAGKINATIGSALDLFGGILSFDEVLKIIYN